MLGTKQPRKKWHLIAFVGFLSLLSCPAWAGSLYVSPSGSGTACSSGSPCTVAQALSAANAGDTILMNDGTYTGDSGMIYPPPGKSGASGSRITIQAMHDGAVLVDGQGARVPMCLCNSNDYFTVTGINFAHSNAAVIAVSNGSDFAEVKRVCAWDADPNNNTQVIVNWGTNNLWEDVCAFGTGRYAFDNFSNNGPTTIRRFWGRFESHNSPAPKITLNPYYSARNVTLENSILTWAETATTNTAQAEALVTQGLTDSNRKIFFNATGNILYLPPGQNYTPADLWRDGYVDELHLKDNVVFVPSGLSRRPLNLVNCAADDNGSGPCPESPNLTLANQTNIGGTASVIGSDWVQTNVHSGLNIGSVYGTESLYVNSGNKGATICYRTVNNSLTSSPLWPWPMNQRIIDALNTAGKTPVDVTATIEQLFGSIPARCKGTASTQPIAPPANLRITSITP